MLGRICLRGVVGGVACGVRVLALVLLALPALRSTRLAAESSGPSDWLDATVTVAADGQRHCVCVGWLDLCGLQGGLAGGDCMLLAVLQLDAAGLTNCLA
jgi:hypothetical protein